MTDATATFNEMCPGIVGNPWLPHWPHPKQLYFLASHRDTQRDDPSKVYECLFGGAAGGGKSDAVLMAAAQTAWLYPGSATVILRLTHQELTKSGALQSRALSWWNGLPGVRWSSLESKFIFPNGSEVALGYHSGRDQDDAPYQSAEYQLVCFDELTYWPTDHAYMHLKSRIRRLKSNMGCPMRILSSANPGGPGHCVPYGDVLTVNGWVPIQDVNVGDRVLTLEDDMALGVETVDQVHAIHHVGTLAEVNARGFHMCCTPDHKVGKVGGTRLANGDWSTVPFADLPGQATILRTAVWEGEPLPSFEVPQSGRSKNKQPKTLDSLDYVKLLGWVLSEGHTQNGNGKQWVSISQQKPETRSRLASFLSDCGFTYQVSESGFTIHDCDWAEHFAQFGKSRDKFIPRDVLNADRQHLGELLESLMDGDGHWETKWKSGVYYTISKQLADDVAELLFKLRYVVHTHQRQRPNRDGLSFEVYFKTVKSGGTELLTGNHVYEVETETARRSDIIWHHVDQEVYCLGVRRTHNFVIRQNGCIWISGNCWVRNRFIGGLDPITGDRIEPVARFIVSKIADNPSLDQDAYWRSLGDLHPTRMAQLRDGDWDARDPGDFFRREWFGPLLDVNRDRWPASDCRRVRWWDLAASEKEDASQTAGCRMARHVRGGSAVEHMVAFRKHPGERDAAIVQMAKLDGPAVVQGFEIEPGSGGQAQVLNLERRLKSEVGCIVRYKRPVAEMQKKDVKILVANPEHLKGKIGRMVPVSVAVYRGYIRRGEGPDPGDNPEYGADRGRGLSDHRHGIRVFAGPWTEAFLDQADEFPVLQPGTQKVLRCDQLEAMGGAWRYLNEHPVATGLPRSKRKELPSGDLADIHPEDRPDVDPRKDRRGHWLP